MTIRAHDRFLGEVHLVRALRVERRRLERLDLFVRLVLFRVLRAQVVVVVAGGVVEAHVRIANVALVLFRSARTDLAQTLRFGRQRAECVLERSLGRGLQLAWLLVSEPHFGHL